MDTCLNYADGTAYFSSDERRWINEIHKLAQQFPDAVVILNEPDSNDGCIYCQIPAKWFKIKPPRQMSEKQMEEMRRRGKALASKRKELSL